MKYRNQFLKYVMHANEGDGGGDAGDAGAAAGGDGGDAGDANPDAGAGGEQAGDGGGDTFAWPEGWRDRFARGDEKKANIAGRFVTPEAAFDALVAAQDRIRSGELKTRLPEKPTDDELAAWRKDNGIPATPEEYDLTFESGLVIGDEDKEYVGDFLKHAHAVNMTPDQVKAAIEWNQSNREAQVAQRLELDDQQRQAGLDELNAEWGGEFRRNINMVTNLTNFLPESVREDFLAARLPDGTALFNNPDVLRGFASLAYELNPAGTLVPAGGGNPMQGLAEEIGKIEKVMKENRAAYNKDEKMQARYRELLDAREKLKARE